MMAKYCRDVNCGFCSEQDGFSYNKTQRVWYNRQSGVVTHYSCEETSLEDIDEVKKPAHYMFSKPANDVLDVLAECGFNMPDHYIASAIAYLCRCKKKNQYRKDLEKAAFYINKAIELHDAEERSNSKNK